MTNNGTSSYQFNSSITTSLKRDALWNIIQPGDPYDIRKSMIAKVPGDKKTYMGDHLELVCLFQAAQIQRLCEFLEDFRQKHRQIQRMHLDRHSYEIQIKQLNHRLAEESSFREENQKLKEFIRNQSSSKIEVEDSIKSRYEKLLLQYKTFEDENLRLRRENENMSMQMSSFDAKFQALRKSKQTQMDQIYMKFSQQSSMSSQMQFQSLRSQYESQVQRLDLQNQRIKQINEQKSRQIESWHQKYRSLQQQLIRSQPRNDVIKYERQIAEYENRFVIFGQEIDRLNLVVKDITVKFEMAQQRSKDLENRLVTINREYSLLQSQSSGLVQEVHEYMRRISELETENRQLQESGRYTQQLDSSLRLSSEEINRLTAQLRLQTQNSSRLKGDLQKYQYEGSKVNILQKQLYEYKQTASQNNLLKEKIAKSQNQVQILKQELSRLEEELNRKGGIDANYQQLLAEYQRLQRVTEEQGRMTQLTIQEYESRIVQINQEYEHRIQTINRTKGNEFESRASMLQSQVQRLGEIIKRRNQQMQNLQRQFRQQQSSMSQSEYEVQRKIQNYESGIQSLKRQNEQLLKRVRQLQPLQRKLSQTQNKQLITSQQVDRLTQQLRQKETDIDHMRRQIREQEIAIVQKYQMDTSRKIGNYQQTLNTLARQHEDLKRKYADLQSKTALLSQEIQRLITKTKEIQLKNTQYEQENQRLQKVIRETQLSITNKYEFEVNQKVANYQTALRNSAAENDSLKRRVNELQNVNESMKRRINELQSISQSLKKRINELQNSNRKLVEYEATLQQLSRQLQRVSSALRQKHEEYAHLQNNYRNLGRQLQQSNRKFVELQNTVKSKYEVQVTRTVSTLEQNISNFTRENTQLKRYLKQYEHKLQSQHAQRESLSVNFRNLAQQNQQLKRQMRQLQTLFNQKMEVEVTNNYRSYETNIQAMKRDLQNFLRENNELKRVLQLSEQSSIKLKQENEDMRRKFQQQSGDITKRFGEYDLLVNKLQAENEGLKRRGLQMQNAIRQYETEAGRKISTLDQTLGNVGRDNQELKRRLQQTLRQNEDMRRMLQNFQKDNQQLARRLRQSSDFNKKIPEYQNALALLSQEHQRTMQLLKAKSQQLHKAQQYINELAQKLNIQQRNITQSQSSIHQFESSVKTQITQYQQNITVITQENNQIKRKLTQSYTKIAEYENKIVIMTQELQRLNLNIRNQLQKQNQLENALRASSAQNQDFRRKIVELQNVITQRYEVEATRNIKTLEQNIEHLQRQGAQLKTYISEYEQRFNAQNIQIQKCTTTIKSLSQENALLKNQLKETQIQFTRRYETQVTTKYSAYEREISNVQRENEQLIRRMREYTERVVPEYQHQVAIMRQEIERLKHQLTQQNGQLGNNLKLMGQQNQQLKRQLQQVHQMRQKQDLQIQQQFTILQQNLTLLQKQNQDMKRYIKQIGGQYEGLGQNFTHLQKENDQLKRTLQQTYGKYESETNKTGSVARENEQLKRILAQMQHEIERLIKKLNEISQQNENIKRQAKQGQVQIVQRFQSQTTQQINIYKQEISQLHIQWKTSQQQLQQLQRRLNQTGTDASRKITQLSQDIEKLNQVIRQYETKLREALHENELVHRKMKDNQMQITQKWEMEFRNKINVYEQNIQVINKTVQEREKQIYDVNNRRIMQLENKVALMSQQIQRLNHILKAKNQQTQKMRLQIQRLNNTLRLKLQEIKQFETEHSKFRSVTQTEFTKMQQSYSLIVRDNQNYKKNLFEYENRINKVHGQFERLQNIINDYKKERETIFEKNHGLVREIERLTVLNKELQINVQEVNLKFSDQAALERRVKEHMTLMVILFAEIESLRKRIKDKERQVQDVRRSSLAPFKLQTRPRNDSM